MCTHIQDLDDEDDDDDDGGQAVAEGRIEKYIGVKVKVKKDLRKLHIREMYLYFCVAFRLIIVGTCLVGLIHWSR